MDIVIHIDPWPDDHGTARLWLTVQLLAREGKLSPLMQRPGRTLLWQQLDSAWGFTDPKNPSRVSLSTAVEDTPEQAIERVAEHVRQALEAVWR